jgi:hypothetical protein
LVPAPTLTPDPNKSATYNAGFREGYEGIPIKGHHHTQDFLIGYENGTSSYWFNRGGVGVENGLDTASKNADYIHGFQQGKAILADRGYCPVWFFYSITIAVYHGDSIRKGVCDVNLIGHIIYAYAIWGTEIGTIPNRNILYRTRFTTCSTRGCDTKCVIIRSYC